MKAVRVAISIIATAPGQSCRSIGDGAMDVADEHKRRRDEEHVAGEARWPMALALGTLVGVRGRTRGSTRRRCLETEGRPCSCRAPLCAGGAGAQELANELVALQPDVIVAHTVSVAAALKHETSAIPIVFVSVGDPLGAGFIASLARPGGTVTASYGLEAVSRANGWRWRIVGEGGGQRGGGRGTKVARPRAIAAADANPLTVLRKMVKDVSFRPTAAEFLWRTVRRAVLSDLANDL